MKMKILIVAVLLASTFLLSVTAQTSPYDPWYDFDDDGDIDIFDTVDFAGRYGTTGTPINKTEMLLDLENRVNDLENRTSALEEQVEERCSFYIKPIRFHDPNETMQDNATLYKYVTFYWIPENTTVNAVLGGWFHFKYRSTGGTALYWHLKVNGTDITWGVFYSAEYEQTQTYHFDVDYISQKAVEIKLGIACTQPAYVKDFTVLLVVADGSPVF